MEVGEIIGISSWDEVYIKTSRRDDGLICLWESSSVTWIKIEDEIWEKVGSVSDTIRRYVGIQVGIRIGI